MPTTTTLTAHTANTQTPFQLFSRTERDDMTNRARIKTVRATFKSSEGRAVPGEWGEILVPENRRVADSRLIALTFRRLGRRDTRDTRDNRDNRDGAPALFHFTGGPGLSNLKQRYPEALLREYSVIEVGYRGIDSTTRLDFPPLRSAAAVRNLASPQARALMAQTFERGAHEWQGDGVDLQGYQMRDVLEDAEDLRQALGFERINLIASSYGTRVALYYMSLHPGAIERTVLIGANPPGHFFWSAADVHKGFTAYQPYFERLCPRHAGRVTLEALCAQVLANAPGRVLGLRLDPLRIRAVTFLLLFHPGTAAYAFDAYLRAYEEGNYVGLAVMSALYDMTAPRAFQWGDLLFKGLVTDYDPERDYAHDVAAGEGRFGSPLGELLFAPPYSPTLFAFRDPPIALQIRTPTLILSGDLDFSTPASTAREELTQRFPDHIQQWSVPDRGHVADFWGDGESLAAIILPFYAGRSLPQASPYKPNPITFRKRFGLAHIPGAMALAALAALASIGLAAMGIGLLAARRKR